MTIVDVEEQPRTSALQRQIYSRSNPRPPTVLYEWLESLRRAYYATLKLFSAFITSAVEDDTEHSETAGSSSNACCEA